MGGLVVIVGIAIPVVEMQSASSTHWRTVCAVLASAMAQAPGSAHLGRWKIIDGAVQRTYTERVSGMSIDEFEQARAWWGTRMSAADEDAMAESVDRCFEIYADAMTFDEFLHLGDGITKGGS
jgi:hypothetical protein